MEEFNGVILKTNQAVEQLCHDEYLKRELNGMLKRIQKLAKLKVEANVSKAVFAFEIENLVNNYDGAIKRLRKVSNQSDVQSQLSELEENKAKLLEAGQDFFFSCGLTYAKEEQEFIQQCMEPLLSGKFGNGTLFGEPFLLQKETETGKKQKQINEPLTDEIMNLFQNQAVCDEVKKYLQKQEQLSELEQQQQLIPRIIKLLLELETEKEVLSIANECADEASISDLNTYRFIVTNNKEQLKQMRRNPFVRLMQKQKMEQLKQDLTVMEPKLKELEEKRAQFECAKKKLVQLNLDQIFFLAREEEMPLTITPNCAERIVAEILKQKLSEHQIDFKKELIHYQLELKKLKKQSNQKKSELDVYQQTMSQEGQKLIQKKHSDCKILMNIIHSEEYKKRNPMIAISILNLICLIQNTDATILMNLLYTPEELTKLKLEKTEKIHNRLKQVHQSLWDSSEFEKQLGKN